MLTSGTYDMLSRRDALLVCGGTVTVSGCTALHVGDDPEDLPEGVKKVQFWESDEEWDRREIIGEDPERINNGVEIVDVSRDENAELKLRGVIDSGDPNCYEFDRHVHFDDERLLADILLVDISDGGDCRSAIWPRQYRLEITFEEDVDLPAVVEVDHDGDYSEECDVE